MHNMGFENWNDKPKPVREAARDGDKEALAAMGRKGAEAAKTKRALEADIHDVQAARALELRQQEERERAESANEHIIDPDGNDLDYNPDR